LLAVSAVLLVSGAELFAGNAAAAARGLGVTVFGAAFLLVGAEPEEMIKAVIASGRHRPGLAARDAIGAKLTMLTLVLGLAAVRTAPVADPAAAPAALQPLAQAGVDMHHGPGRGPVHCPGGSSPAPAARTRSSHARGAMPAGSTGPAGLRRADVADRPQVARVGRRAARGRAAAAPRPRRRALPEERAHGEDQRGRKQRHHHADDDRCGSTPPRTATTAQKWQLGANKTTGAQVASPRQIGGSRNYACLVNVTFGDLPGFGAMRGNG
jgi:hypothetical protein